MSELTDFANRVSRIADGSASRAMLNKAGMAGKKAALDAAADDLGSDRRFSRMRSRARLNAGYDIRGDSAVQINFRPAGLWVLAEQGRSSSGEIWPRRRGGKRAVLTPRGPRARSSYSQSRGLRTIGDAFRDARQEVPKAAARQFAEEVRKLVR